MIKHGSQGLIMIIKHGLGGLIIIHGLQGLIIIKHGAEGLV